MVPHVLRYRGSWVATPLFPASNVRTPVCSRLNAVAMSSENTGVEAVCRCFETVWNVGGARFGTFDESKISFTVL